MNAICKMIKKIDGKHPTLTALAWPSNHVIKEILQRVPDVDIIGLNPMQVFKTACVQARNMVGKDQPS